MSIMTLSDWKDVAKRQLESDIDRKEYDVKSGNLSEQDKKDKLDDINGYREILSNDLYLNEYAVRRAYDEINNAIFRVQSLKDQFRSIETFSSAIDNSYLKDERNPARLDFVNNKDLMYMNEQELIGVFRSGLGLTDARFDNLLYGTATKDFGRGSLSAHFLAAASRGDIINELCIPLPTKTNEVNNEKQRGIGMLEYFGIISLVSSVIILLTYVIIK